MKGVHFYAMHRFDAERKRRGEWDGMWGAKSVDGIHMQTFFAGETNGRIGLVAQNADVVFSELRCWQMLCQSRAVGVGRRFAQY